mgnify:CR=1 FL=1
MTNVRQNDFRQTPAKSGGGLSVNLADVADVDAAEIKDFLLLTTSAIFDIRQTSAKHPAPFRGGQGCIWQWDVCGRIGGGGNGKKTEERKNGRQKKIAWVESGHAASR